jgi:hypothetical protein
MTTIFVHIPKTAGTSFRGAFLAARSADKIVYDYELNATETSDIIKELNYNTQDLWSLQQHLSKNKIEFLAGHFDVERYLTSFGAENMATFVREPISRIVSEYKHFVRNYGFDQGFEAFYRQAAFINKQSKALGTTPLSALGFIGITEQYQQSLQVFNYLNKKKIKELKLNLASEQQPVELDISEAQRQEITKLNHADVNLYKTSLTWFKQLGICTANKVPVVRGWLGGCNNGSVFGTAWIYGSDQAQTIDVFVNDKKIATTKATEYRAHLRHLNLPRNAHVGFSVKLPNLVKGDVITVQDSQYQQPLFQSPFVVK